MHYWMILILLASYYPLGAMRFLFEFNNKRNTDLRSFQYLSFGHFCNGRDRPEFSTVVGFFMAARADCDDNAGLSR